MRRSKDEIAVYACLVVLVSEKSPGKEIYQMPNDTSQG